MIDNGHNGGPPLDDRYPDPDGFVTLGRSIRNHPIVGFGVKGPYVPAEAWIDLIMECRYQEGRVVNGGVVMTIKPGQLVGAVSWLASRWGWTPKQTRSFLDKLVAEGMLSRGFGEAENSDSGATPQNHGNENGKHKGKQAHFLTICNYEIYQFVKSQKGQIEGQLNGRMKGKQGANEGQQYKENNGTKEQGNKEREEREEEADLGLTALVADATPPPSRMDGQIKMGVEVLAAFQSYNALAQEVGLPIAKSLTPSRRRSIMARMREHGGTASWQTLLASIQRSAFLQGQNDRGWRPTGLDWFLNSANFTKVVEGAYGNGAHAKPRNGAPAAPDENYLERMARLMGLKDGPAKPKIQDLEILPPERRQ